MAAKILTAPLLPLKYDWILGEPYKPGMDDNLRLLGAVVQLSVKSRTANQPASPANGDRYIHNGDVSWSVGSTNDVVVRIAGAWHAFTPKKGWWTYVEDEQKRYEYDGGWSEFAGGGGGGGASPSDTRVGYILDPPIFFYENKSVLLSGEDTIPQDVVLSTDSTKMFMLGFGSDSVYQYTVSTAGDLDTATYDAVSLDVSLQGTNVFSLAFKPDGTKMYVLARSNTSVHQYTLSTPWDLSTATADGVSFSVGGQDSDPRAVRFKDDDGAKMYVLGLTSGTVYEYDLATAWDLSTASYGTVSFSVSTQAADAQGLAFSGDYTAMFVADATSATIYRYILSTAGDLSTASYDSFSTDVSGQASQPVALSFRSDGVKLYLVGGSSDTAYQYSASFVA